MVSEGTLIALGLLTAMHRPIRPKVFLVDDLEQGLHPKAQRDLLRILRGLMKEDDQTQIIATTHSPYILDDLNSNEVLLANIGPDGTTNCAYLSEHPDFARWEQEMTSGEFWTVVGENWIKNGVSAGQPQ
jgi:predicted ATPase